MATYQYLKEEDGNISTRRVNRHNDDGSTSTVGNDPTVAAWQQYQAWLAAGNIPTAAA